MDHPETSAISSTPTELTSTETPKLPSEQWLEHRIREALPPDARTKPMQRYATGLAAIQIAASGHLPPAAPPPWSPRWKTIIQNMYKYIASRKFNDASTATRSLVPEPQLICKEDPEDKDMLVVEYTGAPDYAMAELSWRWPWSKNRAKIQTPIPLPQHWQLVPEDQLAEAKQWARYCAAAYCLSDSILSRWGCRSHNGTIPNPTRVHEVFCSQKTGARGYLASIEQENGVEFNPDTKQQIILAFRGTLELRGLAHDLYFAKADYDIPEEFRYVFSGDFTTQMSEIFVNGPRVHKGFYLVTMSIFEQVMKAIDKLIAGWRKTGRLTNKTPVELVILGHSLGGAMAILTVLQILNRKPDWLPMMQIKVYTFGEPRTGNAAFTRLVHLAEKQGYFSIVRVTNAGDPVPGLPPDRLEFRHHGYRWLVREDGSTCRMDPVIRSNLPDEALDAEEGPDMGQWTPISDPLAHLRMWDVLFGPWCTGF
jgi:hypothetical protein